MLFEKAQDKYMQDLDIMSITSAIRKSTVFMKNFLSREQNMLLKFDSNNVIELSDEGNNGMCQFDDLKNNPGEDQDDRLINLLQHKNGLVAMFTLSKLSKILGKFEKKQLTQFEINMAKSFFQSQEGQEQEEDVSLMKGNITMA